MDRPKAYGMSGAALMLVMVFACTTCGQPPAGWEEGLRARCETLGQEMYVYRRLQLEKLPGLEPMTVENFTAYARRMLTDQYGEETGGQQELLERLGALPAGFDLEKLLRERLRELALAAYDYKMGKMLVPEEGASDDSLFHELVHATTDDVFGLERMIGRTGREFDAVLASGAVIEGDATRTALAREMKWMRFGVGLVPWPTLRGEIGRRFALVLPMLEHNFPDVPPALLRTQMFPYHRGWEFMEYVFRRGGWPAVNHAYLRPPRTTEEVLHPSKYWRRSQRPEWFEVGEEVELPADRRVVATNVLGEHGLGVWLGTHLDGETSVKAASGWAGDRVWLVAGVDGSVVVGCSLWDGWREADEFARAVEKWSGTGKEPGRPGARVTRSGDQVRWVVGQSAEERDTVMKWFLKTELVVRAPLDIDPPPDYWKRETLREEMPQEHTQPEHIE